MDNVTLVLASKDERFTSKILKYILDKELGFDIAIFTEVTSLSEHLLNNSLDILVVDEFFISPDVIKNKNSNTKIFLSSSDDINIKGFTRFDISIEPEQFINKATEMYFGSQIDDIMKGICTKVLGFYSVNGGSGSTTVSLSLSALKLLKNQKVFYLNLETFNSSSLFLKLNKMISLREIETLFYNILSLDYDKIKGLIDTDANTKIDFMPFDVLKDKSRFEHIEVLINIIKLSNVYRYIIIDFSTNLNTLKLLSNCLDRCYVVCEDSKIGFKKAELFAKENIIPKKHYILNKTITNKKHADKYIASIPYLDCLSSDINLKNIANNLEVYLKPLEISD